MAFINFQIQVPLNAKWTNIELLRSSVLSCLATIFNDHEFCHAVGMITGELLENAVKYGDWESLERSEFKLHVAGDASQVEVTVSNPVREEGAELGHLFETVDFIRGHDDAESAYRARMREVAAGAAMNSVSRLGLTRVAYEGHCQVQARLDERSILHVTATATSTREA